MENNDAFEGDAEIQALNRSSSQQLDASGHLDAMTAPYGSVETLDHEPSEGEPLLKRNGLKKLQNPGQSTTPDTKWTGDKEYDGLPWWRTPSVWWLLPPFFLFAMAFGGTIVIKINIVLGLICRNYLNERAMKERRLCTLPVLLGGDNPQCRIPEVQALVSKFTLYGSLISGILSAFTSPKLGALSDLYGRTRMMAVSTASMLISEIIFILVTRCPDIINYNFILLGYFFDGLGGSFIAVMAISYAYAADCTPPERRNVVFGYYQACLFSGIALGPLISGYVVKATHNILSIFYVALGVHCLFLIYLLLIAPESLNKKRRLAAQETAASDRHGERFSSNELTYLYGALKRALKMSNILAPLSILWPVGPGTNPAVRRNLLFIAAVDTTMFGIAMGAMTVTLIYSEFMFGWGNFETNIFMSVVNICRVLILLVILPTIIRVLRGPAQKSTQRPSGCDQIDLGIIRVAILFDAMGYVGYATVRTGPLFILCGALAAIGGMGSPTLQSALTKHVPPDRTGQVLGAMGLLHAVARVVAPVIFNLLYAKTVGKFTQAVFVCLAATWGVALLLSLFIRPHVYWDEKYEDTEEDRD